MDYDTLSEQIERALLNLDRVSIKKIILESSSNNAIFELVDKAMVPALERIGKNWEEGSVALSQIYMASKIAEESLDSVLSSITLPVRVQPKMAIVTLQDFHLLGKRIIGFALHATGYQFLDYGRMDVDQVVERTKADGIEILLISTLLLPSALKVKEVKLRLEASGFCPKIVVGGAPFRLDEQLWKEVMADAMGKNSSEAIKIISEITEAKK
jgi:methanogenic corrinoid protein MtbC1